MDRNQAAQLAYHERCKAVCEIMGVDLYGSSFNAEFAYVVPDDCYAIDVPHRAMETIERLASDLKAKDAELTSLKAENEALKEALRDLIDMAETWCGWDLHRCFPDLFPTPEAGFEQAKKDAVIDTARKALSQSKTEVGG